MNNLSQIETYIVALRQTTGDWRDIEKFSIHVLLNKEYNSYYSTEYDFAESEVSRLSNLCLNSINYYFDNYNSSSDANYGKIKHKLQLVEYNLSLYEANYKVLKDLCESNLLSNYGKVCYSFLQGLEKMSLIIKKRLELHNPNSIDNTNVEIVKIDSIYKIVDLQLTTDRKKFEKLQTEANKIDDLKNRILFWSEKKVEYNKLISMQILAASGVVAQKTGLQGEFFLDRLISKEIEHLHKCLEFETQNMKEDYLELETNDNQEKICLLYSLGIIDYIRECQKDTGISENKIAEYLSPILGIKVGSIKTTLSRIANNFLIENYDNSINSKLGKLKLKRIK